VRRLQGALATFGEGARPRPGRCRDVQEARIVIDMRAGGVHRIGGLMR
jgi:hypothetical protein